jgi:uncharacterized protein (TIGR03437 family)
MKDRKKSITWGVACLLGASVPLTLFGLSTGPVARRTGAAVDGGLDCTACHRTFAPANSDPRGRFTIEAASYTPGVKQTIRLRLQHPEATRWGFQLTARLTSDETKMAGTFAATSDVRVRCDTTPAQDAPCDGALEFAEHTQPATRAGTTGGVEFEVEWTPPATDVGEVVFYAAGNAANNSGTNAGDYIYTARLRVAGVAGCPLSGRPTITSVVNAAPGQTGIAPNSMITIFGTGFAAPGFRREYDRFDVIGDQYPRELACVKVEVAGESVPITYISDTQINAQAPTRFFSAPVTVEVVLNKGRANQAKAEKSGVMITDRAPGFFLFSGSTSIAAQHMNFEYLADPSVVPNARPARPGDIVILYGTGFGITEPVYQAGERAGEARLRSDDLSVTVGGITLRREDVLYAGLAPGLITGVYQFNVRLPDSLADGNVPVVIRMGGGRTQEGATIPVRR